MSSADGRDERRHPAEVDLRHRVRAATVRVGDADLPIGEGHDRRAGRRWRSQIGRATPSAAGATPARSSARRISSVAYADELMASELKIASALRLGQSLAELVLGGERLAEHEPARSWPRRARCRWSATLAASLAVSVARARVAEVGGVRSLHADPAVAGLATLQRATASDHPAIQSRSRRRPRGDRPGASAGRPPGSPPARRRCRSRRDATWPRARVRVEDEVATPADHRRAADRRCPG